MVINWYQYYATFAVSLCILSSAMHFAWPSPSLPKLMNGSHTLQITSDEASWLAVIGLIGSIFGGITAMPVLNHFGRIKPIIFSAIPYTIAWLAIAFGSHVAILYTSRFLVGLIDSLAYTSVPMYVCEIADAHIRGLLGSYGAVAFVIGMLLANALGLYLSIYTTALISISFPLLMLFTCLGLPESPYFLIMKGRNEDAIKSLERFKQPHVVQDEFVRLKDAIDEEMKNKTRFIDMFRVPNYRKGLLITLALRCIQQSVGLSAISFYTETIFSEVEAGISSELWVILFYIVKLLMTTFAALILDKTGRKPMILISLIGTALSLSSVAIYTFLEDSGNVDVSNYKYIPIVSLFIYIITYSIGAGPIPVLMLGELMSPNIKSYALCLVDMSTCIIGTLSSLYFQHTNDAFGLGVPFLTFAFCAVIGVGFVVIFLPETKGKTLEDIQDKFRNVKSIKSASNNTK